MRILVLALLVGFTVYGWDRGKAMAFLESRQTQWAAWKPAQKRGGACLSCHTGLSYLLAGRVLGDGEQGRKLVAGVRHRLRVTPVDATLPDPGAEAVLNLFALAMFRKGAGEPVGEAERAALADLWARQVWDGKDKGSWTWVNAALHPMDSELSHYWGTAMAERALAAFPAGPAERVEAMRAYLRREAVNQPLHHRLAWAAFGERSAGAQVLRDLWAAQAKDGGWSTVALGPWSEQKDAPVDKGSNAYATAWAAYAAHEAGVSCSDKRLRRALDWLEVRQDRETGAWRAVSMNKTYPTGSIQEGFLTDAATGFAAAVLGACDTDRRERYQRSN